MEPQQVLPQILVAVLAVALVALVMELEAQAGQGL
jgi:hypothetical protein